MMRKFIITALVLLSLNGIANPPKVFSKFYLSAELETKHIWRGLLSSSSPTFTGDISFKENNWSVSLWTAQALNQEYSEIDLNLCYSFQSFTFGLYDYYCPKPNKQNEIIDFAPQSTDHSIDLVTEFAGTKKFPISILGSVLLYGDDRNPIDFNNYYSMYFELGYRFYQQKEKSIRAKIGFTPNKSIYGQQAGIANLQLSMQQLLHFSKSINMPFCAEIIASPLNKSLLLNFHIGLINK